MAIAYRREIDGVRAIAVTSVVLYHAGLGGAGFVGVDIFFVISGYLITSLLLREHQDRGRIDLLAFYARRVRRIFPAAAACVLATLAAASMLLSADDFIHTAHSAAAAATFVANFFFESVTGGYFDTRSEEMPLLHLWSLSVEEQFYLLWPALMIVLLRGRRLPFLAGLAAASLALAEWWMHANPEAAFYQTPARFWELAAGAIVAVLPERAVPRWLAWTGMAVVVGACVWPPAHFPGAGALPAVLGTCLLLYAIHCGATNRVLASTPFVGVGLISYSLYLWHWPLLAFYRATTVGEGSTSVRLQLCAVAVVLAIASYRYIEQPFRRSRWPARRLVLAGASGSLAIALGACAWGLSARVVEAEQPIGNVLALVTSQDRPSDDAACDIPGGGEIGPLPPPRCGSANARIVLWGDSFGTSWLPFVWELAAREHQPATAFYMHGCPPLLGYVRIWNGYRDERCAEFNRRAAAALQGRDTVVIALHWSQWMHGPQEEAGLRASLDAVVGARRLLIVGPTPDLRDLAPRCIEKHSSACDVPRADFEAKAKPYQDMLYRAIAGRKNVEVIDPTEYLCTLDTCPATKDGVGLYWDKSHLSATATTGFALRWLLGREDPSKVASVARY